MADKKVTLRNADTDKHEEFSEKHAERLLGYPGTRFQALKPEAAPAKATEVAKASEAPKATAKS